MNLNHDTSRAEFEDYDRRLNETPNMPGFFGHIKFLGTTFKGRHQKWYPAEAKRGFTEKRPPFLDEDIPKWLPENDPWKWSHGKQTVAVEVMIVWDFFFFRAPRHLLSFPWWGRECPRCDLLGDESECMSREGVETCVSSWQNLGPFQLLHTVDGSEIPNNHLGRYQTL